MAAPHRLKFFVVHASTSHTSHPASNLQGRLKALTEGQGWQSGNFCAYPQDVVLGFEAGVVLVRDGP